MPFERESVPAALVPMRLPWTRLFGACPGVGASLPTMPIPTPSLSSPACPAMTLPGGAPGDGAIPPTRFSPASTMLTPLVPLPSAVAPSAATPM